MNDFIQEVFAIALRDWKKSAKLWKVLLAVSIVGLAIFGVGWGFNRIASESVYVGSYSSFFSFGFLVYIIFINGVNSGAEMIMDSKNFIKLLLVAPISKYSLLFGKTLSTLTGLIKFILLLGAFLLLLNKEFSMIKLLFILVYCVFLAIVSVATGLFISTISKSRRVFSYVNTGFMFVFLLLSGILFPISSLPDKVQIFFRINPLIYIIDLFRYLMIGTAEFSLLVDVVVSLVFGLIMIFLGVYQFDRNLRR